MNDMIVVFVYGTLMRGGSNHYLLGNGQYLGEARADNYCLYDVTESFPGVLHHCGKSVLGEVYSVDQPTFEDLDELESNGYLYQREQIGVTLTESEEIVTAWIYVWLSPVNPELEVPYNQQPWRKSWQNKGPTFESGLNNFSDDVFSNREQPHYSRRDEFE